MISHATAPGSPTTAKVFSASSSGLSYALAAHWQAIGLVPGPAPLPPAGPADNWGQNRDLMARGHATGFPQHLGTEDFAMFLSQGPIVDRTDEQLCSADGAVLRVRSALLKAVREFQAGKTPTLADNPALDYRQIRSVGGVLAEGTDWRTLVETA